MKKWLSVALMICLLMLGMTGAIADAGVYHDGYAPEVVMVNNDQGVACVGVIKDAQGNVIATIPEDSLMKILCVGDPYQEHPEIEDLLDQSFDTLLKDQHVSNAEWLLETDLFYVEIPEEYAGYMTDGAVLEIVFKPLIMQEVDQVGVLTTLDGNNWNEATSVSFDGNGTVTVGIDQSCVVAFTIPHGSVAGGNSMAVTPDEDDVIQDEINANFTPSVSGKPDPQVVTTVVEGENCYGVIVSTTGEVLGKVTEQDEIVVTPLSEGEVYADITAYEHLQWAYDSICEVSNLGNLANQGGQGTLASEIDSRLQGTGLTHEDLTVSDLFKVSVYGDSMRMLLDDPNARVELTVERNFRQDDILMVLYADDIDSWSVLGEEYVTINEDGSVTLSLEKPGVVAFLVENQDAANPDGAVVAP